MERESGATLNIAQQLEWSSQVQVDWFSDEDWNIFDFLGFDEEDFEDTTQMVEDEEHDSDTSESSTVFPDWFEND